MLGRLAQQAAAGFDRKAFSGKIGGRVLTPGSYRATLVAVDLAGKCSAPARITFTVTRRRAGHRTARHS